MIRLQHTHLSQASVLIAVLALLVQAGAALGAAQTLSPTKDGTHVDGGTYGPFDGQSDDEDWTFNGSSYEGSITLSTSTEAADIEHRLVWEYNLSTITSAPPVLAALTLEVRGAPVWPFPDVVVHVYSYPADLLETADDFSSGPTELQGSFIVVPFQPKTAYTLNVSTVVSDALTSGTDMVAFRVQIDPNTTNPANQAFIDAEDANPTTKPQLTVNVAPAVPGDADGSGQVDLPDHAQFWSCMSGPTDTATFDCLVFDFDEDADVDLDDFKTFETFFTP